MTWPLRQRILGFCVAVFMTGALFGCGGGDTKPIEDLYLDRSSSIVQELVRESKKPDASDEYIALVKKFTEESETASVFDSITNYLNGLSDEELLLCRKVRSACEEDIAQFVDLAAQGRKLNDSDVLRPLFRGTYASAAMHRFSVGLQNKTRNDVRLVNLIGADLRMPVVGRPLPGKTRAATVEDLAEASLVVASIANSETWLLGEDWLSYGALHQNERFLSVRCKPKCD
jgi:hypothetical protein